MSSSGTIGNGNLNSNLMPEISKKIKNGNHVLVSWIQQTMN
ncbi:hypothetical protein PY093_03960 [Cytobacillus sp. S13-E01]|nr:hypothetical protein [Cytobacillus sp. S13-E01]MDF0725869.1 hypothetical protein [Cytobacillus sp. S13-E01]